LTGRGTIFIDGAEEDEDESRADENAHDQISWPPMIFQREEKQRKGRDGDEVRGVNEYRGT
jgi:hypothetical protein